MASLSTTAKKKSGNRFRSDSDAVTLPEAVANPLKDYILESARTIHRTELTMAFLRWMLSVVAVFFSLVLIDQWLWPLSTAARYVVWVGFIGGTVLWFTMMVLPLIGRTIHPHYAARQIETTLPEMKEGLITWVQLSGSDTPPPKSVLNAVGRYVAKQLKGQDIASVIDQLNPLKLAAALMGLTLIGAIYLATSPKNVPATIQRLLMPWANIAPATRVQIVSITPGDTSVIQGSNASIAIQVRGWQRQDKAAIRYATDDGQTVDQRVAMSSDIEGLSYRIELGKSFGGILQPMHYWVEAGDAIAGPFAIQVQAIPLSTLERVDYVYPAYTRMSPRTIESDGRIEGPEGTRVRVTARGNQPMKSARVEFDSTLAQDGSYQPEWIRDLQVDDRSITGDWILEVNEKRSNPSRYQYRIRSTNMLGESAPEPVVYPMTVVADMAPEVDFAAEIKDIIEVAENSSIDLEMRANDPDFGLVKLVLDGTAIGSKNRGSVLQETLIEDAAGLTGQSVHTLSVAPKQLGLQSGDKIDLVLTASDNRHDPQTSKPAPNVVKSRAVTLKVTPPVKNPNPNEDASGGKQKNQSNDPSQPDDTLKSKSPSAPQQPNKKTSNETPDNSNEKPSGEQKPNKQDQSKQDQSKQASDQASDAQKDDSQGSNEQEKPQSQPKSTPNQPQSNAADQPQNKDQPPRDQKQQPDSKKTEQQQPKDSQSKDQSSKDQSGKDQSSKDQGSGDDPSGASESSDSSGGQPQGSQKSAGGKSGGQSSDSSGDASNDSSGEPAGAQSQGAPGAGKESPSGNQSPGMKSDPSDPSDPQSSGSKANPSESNASDGDATDGDASDGQTPTHDGEAFERLQKILNQSKSNESPGKSPDNSSSPDNASDQKSGDSSRGQADKKQQSGNPKDASASNGNKSDSPNSDSPNSDSQSSDSQPSNQPNKSNTDKSNADKSNTGESDTSKSDTSKSDPAKSNSDDKSKANEPSVGDDSKASSDKGAPNQSKTSPKNNASEQNSPSGQESNPNDSKPNESNGNQGLDKSEGGTANNAKPADSKSQNPHPEGKQPKDSDSKSSDPSGSKSTSEQSGEKGASSDSSNQDAANNSSSKSSDGDPAKGNPSKGDSKPSEGKSQDASSKGSQSEGSGQAKGSSGESKTSSGSSKPSGASSGGSQGMNSSGESGTAAGSGAGENESSASTSRETTEYAKSATDLVLDSLKRQREQPDPELLKRMGWNKEQMQAFVDRWQAARDQAMLDPSKKKDYEDMLQSLGLVPQTGSTRAVLGRTDGLTGIREEGSRVRPPESLRERFEAFRKASQNAGTK